MMVAVFSGGVYLVIVILNYVHLIVLGPSATAKSDSLGFHNRARNKSCYAVMKCSHDNPVYFTV